MTIDGGLRPLFRQYLPEMMWTSIETGGTGRGISDSNFLSKTGEEGWIEFKQTHHHGVTLLPEQIAWIERRVRYGGRTFIAVRRHAKAGPRRGDAVDELWLLPGALARPARLGGLRDPAVAVAALCWPGGPARWDWPAVAAALVAPAGGHNAPKQKGRP